MWHGEPQNILNKYSLKSWVFMRFDFLRKPKPTVPHVRRRLRFAWLWRFFDLWQAVKKEFFDSLKNASLTGRHFSYFLRSLFSCSPSFRASSLVNFPFAREISRSTV